MVVRFLGSTISVTAVGNLRSATPSRERAMAVPIAQATRVACFGCNATSARPVFWLLMVVQILGSAYLGVWGGADAGLGGAECGAQGGRGASNVEPGCSARGRN